MSREIGIVPTDEILVKVWPDVDSVLGRHGLEWMEENDLGDQDVFKKILTSEWQLWLGTDEENLDGVMITRFDGPELHILWLGGSGLEKHLLEGLEMIERFALHHEAREVVVGGRPGWERVLGKLGYARKGEWLVKDLVKAYAH